MTNNKTLKFVGVGLIAAGMSFVACSSEDDAVPQDGASGGTTNQGGEGNGTGAASPGTGAASNGTGSAGGEDGSGGASNEGGSGTGAAAQGGAPSAETVLLEDDFSKNTASWIFEDPEPGESSSATNSVGDWSYSSGRLIQASNYAGCPTGPAVDCDAEHDVPTLARPTADGSAWTDYSVSAEVVTYDDDVVALMARYVDNDNYLLLEINLQSKYARLRAIQGGVWTTLNEDLNPSINYKKSVDGAEEPFTLKLKVVGAQYTGYLNGTQIVGYTDNTSEVAAAGGIALGSIGSQGLQFDSVKVVEE